MNTNYESIIEQLKKISTITDDQQYAVAINNLHVYNGKVYNAQYVREALADVWLKIAVLAFPDGKHTDESKRHYVLHCEIEKLYNAEIDMKYFIGETPYDG